MDVFSWSIPFVIEKVTEILIKTADPNLTQGEDITSEEPTQELIHEKLVEPAPQVSDGSKKTGIGSKADLLRKKV